MILLVGVGLRVGAFLVERPLDGDELSLYRNLQKYDGGRLVAGRLDATGMTQAAPPLFLLVEDAAANRWPPPMTIGGERWLRLLPLVCGLLTLPAALWLAALAIRPLASPEEGLPRINGPWLPPAWPTALLLAAAAVSFSSRLIDVSHRTKQYAGDCLVAVVLIALLLSLRRRGVGTLRRHLILGLAAAASLWLSHPAVLVYAALGLADVLLDADGRKPLAGLARRLLAAAPGGLVAVGSGLCMYLFSAARQRDEFLDKGWQRAFAAGGHHWWDWPLQILRTTQDLPRYGLPPLGALWGLLAIAGGVALWRRGERVAVAALAGPVVTTVAAASAGLYPFIGQRVCLFLAPPLLVLAAVGAAWLLRARPTAVRMTATALAVVPLGFAAVDGVRAAATAEPLPRRAAAALARHYEAGDAILAFEQPCGDVLAVYEPTLPPAKLWFRRLKPPLEARWLPTPEQLRSGHLWLLVGPKAEAGRLLTPEALSLLPAGWTAEPVETLRGGEVLLVRPPPQ